MSKENGLERAKIMLYGHGINRRSDAENEQNLGPGNALLYVAKFQRLVAPKVQYPDKTGFKPKYTVNSNVLGGCTD